MMNPKLVTTPGSPLLSGRDARAETKFSREHPARSIVVVLRRGVPSADGRRRAIFNRVHHFGPSERYGMQMEGHPMKNFRVLILNTILMRCLNERVSTLHHMFDASPDGLLRKNRPREQANRLGHGYRRYSIHNNATCSYVLSKFASSHCIRTLCLG